VLPDFGPPGRGFSGDERSGSAGCPLHVHQQYQGLIPDGAMCEIFVVVSTPSLHLCPGVVKAQEPVRIQALGRELSVEGLDIGVIGWHARTGEIEAPPSGKPIDPDLLRRTRHLGRP
jgi:hypothetical protein